MKMKSQVQFIKDAQKSLRLAAKAASEEKPGSMEGGKGRGKKKTTQKKKKTTQKKK